MPKKPCLLPCFKLFLIWFFGYIEDKKNVFLPYFGVIVDLPRPRKVEILSILSFVRHSVKDAPCTGTGVKEGGCKRVPTPTYASEWNAFIFLKIPFRIQLHNYVNYFNTVSLCCAYSIIASNPRINSGLL